MKRLIFCPVKVNESVSVADYISVKNHYVHRCVSSTFVVCDHCVFSSVCKFHQTVDLTTCLLMWDHVLQSLRFNCGTVATFWLCTLVNIYSRATRGQESFQSLNVPWNASCPLISSVAGSLAFFCFVFQSRAHSLWSCKRNLAQIIDSISVTKPKPQKWKQHSRENKKREGGWSGDEWLRFKRSSGLFVLM